ncbi:MAG: glycosyltransferase family 2 protein [Acidobacteria bacterium]|nr:glycosyltransferase family 2 protein [Acidobacteriota bacterium]
MATQEVPSTKKTSNKDLPSVSILIVTRNNADELIAALKSLSSLRYPKGCLELVVFDNGSTDTTCERVQSVFERFQADGWASLVLQRACRNLGAFGGRAEALGFLSPQSEFILCLDDDVEVTPESLTLLLDAISDSNVGVAGARIVYHDKPEETASGAGYFNRWLGIYKNRAPADRTTCHFVTTCGCLIRRATLEVVGGFDRDYFTSHGDVDLCLRMTEGGYRVVYEPLAVIRHKVARGGTRTPERIYYVYRNKLLLLRKHLPQGWSQPMILLYSILWLPKIFVNSLAYHQGLNWPEMCSVSLAIFDAWLDRRGEGKWFQQGATAEKAGKADDGAAKSSKGEDCDAPDG